MSGTRDSKMTDDDVVPLPVAPLPDEKAAQDAASRSVVNNDNSALLEALAQALQDEEERVMALPSMQITEQEREWALAIKKAVEADDELKNLSDLEYVQYAIATEGDVPGSLKRAKGLQLFRQEYGINDTLDQGTNMLQAMLQDHEPGLILSVDKVQTTTSDACDDPDLFSHFVFVLDFAKINPKGIHLPSHKRDTLGALYYAHHATQTTPAAIRNGCVFIAECEGMTFDNISLDFLGSLFREMKSHYPIRIKEISWLRAATAATVMFALAKPFLPRHVRETVNLQYDFQAYDGRLDALFLTKPTPEENAMFILQKTSSHLAERLRNEKLFRL